MPSCPVMVRRAWFAAIVGTMVLASCVSGDGADDVATTAPTSASTLDDDESPAADPDSGDNVDGDDSPSEQADLEDGESGSLGEGRAGGPPDRITICHRTNGSSEYVEITISESAIDAHLNHPWGEDIIPAPPEGCPDAVDPTTTVAPTTTDSSSTTTEPATTTTEPASTTTEPATTTTTTNTTTTTTTTSTTTTVVPPPGTTLPPIVSTTTPSTTVPASTAPPSTDPPDPTTTEPGGVLPTSSEVPGESTTTIETGVSPGGPGELPGTGNDDAWLALAAALLIGLGVWLTRVARRPRLDRG